MYCGVTKGLFLYKHPFCGFIAGALIYLGIQLSSLRRNVYGKDMISPVDIL